MSPSSSPSRLTLLLLLALPVLLVKALSGNPATQGGAPGPGATPTPPPLMATWTPLPTFTRPASPTWSPEFLTRIAPREPLPTPNRR